MSVTTDIIDIVKPILEDMGYDLIDLKYGKFGKRWLLQIFADKAEGITVDDCKAISSSLNYELDRHPDLIKNAYSLEVSSPGLERPLVSKKDFERKINKNLVLWIKESGTITEEHGLLKEVNDTSIMVQDSSGIEKSFKYDDIHKAIIEVKI